MRKTTETLEEKKALDPRVFKDNKIDPMQIHGFADFVYGKSDAIKDHPDFPNPRSLHNMDLHVVSDIESSGQLLEPIKLYWNAAGEVILADGKTRMTGIGLHLRKNPQLIGKLEVPLQRLRASDNEVRLLMLQYNTKDSRRPLTEADVSKYLRQLEAKGVTEDEQLRVLDKSGKRGKIWLNHMKQILDANPAVVDAYESGQIDFTTAKMIAKAEWQQQPANLDKVLELKRNNPDKTEAEIRKLSGVKKANRVTMGFDPTIDFFLNEVFIPHRHLLTPDKDQEKRWKDMQKELKSFLKDKGFDKDFEAFLSYNAAKDVWEQFMWFLRIGSLSLEDQKQFIIDNLNEEQREKLTSADAAEETKKSVRRSGKGSYVG